MSARRVLITGGLGFIGRHLVAELGRRGDEVTVLDAVAPPHDAPRARYVTGDIRDAALVADAARGVDLVLHMAAVVGVDQYLGRPLDVLEVNVDGTRAVLDACADAGARLLLASTSEIYGRNPAVPWSEDADRVLGPTTTSRWGYSSSKAMCEHLAFSRAQRDDLDVRVVRYFNVYGPGQRPAFVISRSVHRALNGHALPVYDGGLQTRCFTDVDDVVEGTLRAADEPTARGEVFNIGSHREYTVAEAVRTVAKVVGESDGAATPETVEIDTRAAFGPTYQDLDRRVPDTRKAHGILGWQATRDLETGVRRTVAWARATPSWLALPDTGADATTTGDTTGEAR